MDLSKLISLEADELGKQFGWIDWRSYETEVIETFQYQLGEPCPIDYREEAGGSVIILFDGREHLIPLTHTGCDRYVMICSLAEILSRTHDVWLSKAAMEDDTHGVLLLSKNQSEELVKNHSSWVENNLQPLKNGVDEFSGITIPYYGHEDNAPEFETQHRAQEEEWKARREEVDAETARIIQRKASLKSSRKKFRLKDHAFPVTLILAILFAFVFGLYSGKQKLDCRIRVDGKCLDLGKN